MPFLRMSWPTRTSTRVELADLQVAADRDRYTSRGRIGGVARVYFMCDDIDATVEELTAKGVEFSQPVTETHWGRLVRFQLPGGRELGMYEPRHDRATDL